MEKSAQAEEDSAVKSKWEAHQCSCVEKERTPSRGGDDGDDNGENSDDDSSSQDPDKDSSDEEGKDEEMKMRNPCMSPMTKTPLLKLSKEWGREKGVEPPKVAAATGGTAQVAKATTKKAKFQLHPGQTERKLLDSESSKESKIWKMWCVH